MPSRKGENYHERDNEVKSKLKLSRFYCYASWRAGDLQFHHVQEPGVAAVCRFPRHSGQDTGLCGRSLDDRGYFSQFFRLQLYADIIGRRRY